MLLEMLVGHTMHATPRISTNCKQEFGHKSSKSVSSPFHFQDNEGKRVFIPNKLNGISIFTIILINVFQVSFCHQFFLIRNINEK